LSAVYARKKEGQIDKKEIEKKNLIMEVSVKKQARPER
jgi:hypothetical protein